MNSPQDPVHEDGLRVAALAQRLLRGEFGNLSAREQRVIASIARRETASRDVNAAVAQKSDFGQRLADTVASFGGSWMFIILFLLGLAVWIAVNVIELHSRGSTFDAYPFVFLNLMLSMVSALQAPFILMSQNRQAARDRIAAGLDYEINLKAELEIMTLHDKLDTLHMDRFEATIEAHLERLSELVAGLGKQHLQSRPGDLES